MSPSIRAGAAVLCASLVLACSGAAAQSEGLLRAAVDRHQSVSLHNWRFDRVRFVEGMELRERCIGIDYRKAECRLRLVDGAPPDEKALERYAKKVEQPVAQNLPNVDVAKYIDYDTLAGDGTEHAVALYAFDRKPDPDDENIALSEQKGQARVHREEGFVEQLTMQSSKVFKPATGVKINNLALTMDFVEVDEAVFVEQVKVNVKGRAFGLKKLDEEEVFRFENFVAPY